MSLASIAEDLWSKVLATEHAIPVIQAVITGVEQTASGKAANVIESIQQTHPEVMATIEALAQQAGSFAGGPLAGFAAKEFVEILAKGHSMTPDEEALWFARQGSGAGA